MPVDFNVNASSFLDSQPQVQIPVIVNDSISPTLTDGGVSVIQSPSMTQEVRGRARTLSRSSSVPTKINDGRFQASFDSQLQTGAPLTKDGQPLPGPTRHSSSSVRHLTCYWWKTKGTCRYNDDDCLYAHYDTGHYTDPPRQVIPGEPAMAGRKLERTVRNLQIQQRLSNSTGALLSSRQSSRASTPGLEFRSPSPSPTEAEFQRQFGHYRSQLKEVQRQVARLDEEKKFLESLVNQDRMEKAVLMSHITDLKVQNQERNEEIMRLRRTQVQLADNNELLRQRNTNLLETQGVGMHGAQPTFGAIGQTDFQPSENYRPRTRGHTETKLIGRLLDEAE